MEVVPVYEAVIVLHSLMRWIVVLAGLWAVVRAIGGFSTGRAWTHADDRAGLAFTLSIDIQTLLGLLLYVALSPITARAFADIGAAMRNGAVRFWVAEHVAVALVAVALVHVGRVRVRRAAEASRHRRALVFFGLALAALLAAIPWPFLTYGRPWLPIG